MPATEHEEWLTSRESASVGTRQPGQTLSVGQLAGMRTLDLLAVPDEDWNQADIAHARRVVGYVRRHRAQWPAGDVSTRRWRHALRNWGHDPLWQSRLELTGVDEVVLHLDGSPVGRAVLDTTEHTVAALAMDIDEQWRRRGIGTAALHTLTYGTGRRLTPGPPGVLPERLADRLR